MTTLAHARLPPPPASSISCMSGGTSAVACT